MAYSMKAVEIIIDVQMETCAAEEILFFFNVKRNWLLNSKRNRIQLTPSY